MISRLPPLKPLRAFEATARTGSVTAAAKELNVTHSAISHQIKTLETSLGLKLFDRQAQRLKLTSQGALLMPAVSNAFKEIAATASQMSRPSTEGRLSVSCSPALLSYWLVPRIGQFTEQYPNVQLALNSSVDRTKILSPAIDVSIIYGAAPAEDCWGRLWAQFDLFPVTSPTHLNRRTIRNLKDLEDQVLLHTDDGREWNSWFDAASARNIVPKQHHYMGDARVAIDAALNGHGVALGDTLTSSSLLSDGSLVVPFDLAVPANDAFYVACRNEIRSTPIVNVFIDWLFAALEEDKVTAPFLSSGRHISRRRSKKADIL
ncbi:MULTISPECIES: LysR substrate-binding domain-containing protein [Sneathiella]|jgi:LysR family glycine cleavage system transcriptional activator|uniref:LysR substrate-binding domain-containing protein n=1 Tax=Sneathiella TaxID=510690 RepID=UPI00146D4CD4|nr:LysR substrate-binding domain-containing protein [Sneathiella aquimaris]